MYYIGRLTVCGIAAASEDIMIKFNVKLVFRIEMHLNSKVFFYTLKMEQYAIFLFCCCCCLMRKTTQNEEFVYMEIDIDNIHNNLHIQLTMCAYINTHISTYFNYLSSNAYLPVKSSVAKECDEHENYFRNQLILYVCRCATAATNIMNILQQQQQQQQLF